jgi:hypothetical protein
MFIKSEYDDHGAVSHLFGRKQLGSRLSSIQQELDSFGARFRVSMRNIKLISALMVLCSQTNRLVDISIQQGTMEKMLDKVHDMVSVPFFIPFYRVVLL